MPNLPRSSQSTPRRLLELVVTDQATALLAKEDRAAAKQYIAEVEGILKEPTSIAHQLHKSFTTLRGTLTKDAQAVIEHHDKQVAEYARAERKRLADLQAQLQAQADADARAEQERLNAEHAAEVALPEWLRDEQIAAQPVPVVTAPKVEIAKMPIAEGFSDVNKPWSAEVKDIKALCRAVADGLCDAECITVNQPFLNTAAKLYKSKLSEKFPGVEGVQGKRIKY